MQGFLSTPFRLPESGNAASSANSVSSSDRRLALAAVWLPRLIETSSYPCPMCVVGLSSALLVSSFPLNCPLLGIGAAIMP